MSVPFHLAFPVTDLEAARRFYGGLLGCAEGRSAERWVDFDLYGHQISAHLRAQMPSAAHNAVDGDAVPVPHFGCILEMDAWRALRDRLVAAGVDFIVGPRIRFEGQPGEQATLFLLDPSGNALEFKAFDSRDRIFSTGG